MNEHDLQQQLQQPAPTPDATVKAQHMAAALAAFQAQQTLTNDQCAPEHHTGEVSAQEIPTENLQKKSNVLQGFLQRLRLTRDINHHGSDSMNSSHFENRPLWQKPTFISGIAASSLAVLAGVAFIQHLAVTPIDNELSATLAKQSMPLNEPLASQDQARGIVEKKIAVDDAIEEVVVSGLRAESAPQKSESFAVQQNDINTGAETLPAPAPQSIAPLGTAEPALQPLIAAAREHKSTIDINAPKPQEFRDRFEDFKENSVIAVSENPVSTFSIDVDTASYSFVRRMLNNGQLPAKDAVRTEEMINYFDYTYPAPRDKKTPFATNVSVVDSPWKKGNQLVHIGIQGYSLPASDIPQSNLVFLLDVSGSMDEPSKLPLVKQSMGLLLDTLKPDDTIAIVVYAGAAGTVLEPTKVKDKNKILAALNNLQAGGSTAGAEGIALAYQLAETNFNAKGVNRIILATDGDFNVGQTSDDALQDLIERKREKGIYLSVLGFGQDNYQDALMQTLAQNGNGTAAYIDTLSEAQKVLVNEATSTLFPIAKDVKIQVEFNPATVAEYRLVGYETRALNREDFNNDKVDAGEIGSGHKVTAIYEVTPVNSANQLLEPSRYQQQAIKKANSNELAFLRVRYKLPGENQSTLIETPINKDIKEIKSDYQQEVNFSIAVASFAQLLRGSNYIGDYSYDKVIEQAQANKGKDEYGYRTEFIQLVRKAKIAKPM
ncbi:MAG TPA: VWA domain-containing protein [Cellvibrio sp.]|nr:VWA domain-containing protein [Cellvibrio sp.]